MNAPTTFAPLAPPTMQQPMVPTPMGLGEPIPISVSPGVVVLGLAIAAGGAYAGYKVGEKVGAPRHATAGKVIGAIAGWFIVPAVIGGILGVINRASTTTPTA